MRVFRICRSTYAKDLSGAGAGRFGGRWNPVGLNLLYTAGTISLAYLEYLVHNMHILAQKSVCLVTLEIHKSTDIQYLKASELAPDWNTTSYLPRSTQDKGEAFISSGKHYVLAAPSAIVSGEWNYLLNPNHPLHAKTRIVEILDPFNIDQRLLE